VTGLFDPVVISGPRRANRLVVSSKCPYSAVDGLATDWHRLHYAMLGDGSAGLLFMEATVTSPAGTLTPHCLYVCSDESEAAPHNR